MISTFVQWHVSASKKGLLSPMLVGPRLDVGGEILHHHQVLISAEQVFRQSLNIKPIISLIALALQPEVQVEAVYVNHYATNTWTNISDQCVHSASEILADLAGTITNCPTAPKP